MKKPVDLRKISQILGVYAFSLVAAVACGDSFVPKKFGEKGFVTMDKTVNDSSFRPNIVSISRYGHEAGTDIKIEIKFTDGKKPVAIAVEHSADKKHVSATVDVEKAQYSAVSFCETETCDDVGLILTKIDNAATPATVEQSSFHLVSAENQLLIAKYLHKTEFNDAQEALNYVRGSGNK